jgi:1-acyl-sn-glycerol-3-phosphate acyltransferase
MNALLRLLFRITGWKILGEVPDLKKYVIAVAPHTSWWDFLIGIMARSTMGITGAKFLGKKELFDGPFGWFFRWMGGVGVDRFSSHDVVTQVVDEINRHDNFILGLAPEGTRKKVEKLRPGFYYIAKGAGIPIVPVGFDFPTKSVIIGKPLYPSENINADMEILMTFFRKIRGKRPELGL